MADTKSHAAIKKHLANAKAAHKQVGDSMGKIEELLGAMQGAQQQPAQQPAAPGLPSNGMSPMGGMAR